MPGLLPFWSGNAIPHAIALPRRSEHYGYGCPAGVSRRDLQSAPDPFRTLGHDGEAVTTVRAVVGEALAVVGDLDLRVRRVHGAGNPQIRGSGVLARVGDRLLGDAQQLGLGRGGQSRRGLVEGEVDPEA